MVFVKDTKPEKIVKGLGPGERLHVFGLPRIDLDSVARYVARYMKKRESREPPELHLPYEIVIVGVYSGVS